MAYLIPLAKLTSNIIIKLKTKILFEWGNFEWAVKNSKEAVSVEP